MVKHIKKAEVRFLNQFEKSVKKNLQTAIQFMDGWQPTE
jgi:hypothetical protein